MSVGPASHAATTLLLYTANGAHGTLHHDGAVSDPRKCRSPWNGREASTELNWFRQWRSNHDKGARSHESCMLIDWTSNKVVLVRDPDELWNRLTTLCACPSSCLVVFTVGSRDRRNERRIHGLEQFPVSRVHGPLLCPMWHSAVVATEKKCSQYQVLQVFVPRTYLHYVSDILGTTGRMNALLQPLRISTRTRTAQRKLKFCPQTAFAFA